MSRETSAPSGTVHASRAELTNGLSIACNFERIDPDADAIAALAASVAAAERPAFLVGSDAFWDGAEAELEAAATSLGVPCFFNGLGRGLLPADHSHVFLRTRSLLK